MICIILPAHNESAVIGRTLGALLDGAGPDELEIIVACNGCTDDTARVARAFGPAVRVIEISDASKVAALNVADAIATAFPRFYMDADVRVSIGSIRRIAAVLREGPILAAAPALEMDLSDASWPVRAYYRAWMRMPYLQEGMMGVGVYALSEAGRAQFDRFPDVIADDGYIRQFFPRECRTAVASARSIVTAPRSFWGLIKIKTRSKLGLLQLRERFPSLFEREAREKRYSAGAWNLLSRPGLWPCIIPYVLVNLLARWRAKRQYRRLSASQYVWERDTSSRACSPPPALRDVPRDSAAAVEGTR